MSSPINKLALEPGNFDRILTAIKSGDVLVMPTDTIYGLVSSAERPEAVERIYSLKKRPLHQACIVLIADWSHLSRLGVNKAVIDEIKQMEVWPDPISIVLPVSEGYQHVHRGGQSIAFRWPEPEWLQVLVKQTGPIIATSANLSGHPFAEDIDQASSYFAGGVDLYVDAGIQYAQPSKLLKYDPQTGSFDSLR